jgi:hypothetical protein
MMSEPQRRCHLRYIGTPIINIEDSLVCWTGRLQETVNEPSTKRDPSGSSRLATGLHFPFWQRISLFLNRLRRVHKDQDRKLANRVKAEANPRANVLPPPETPRQPCAPATKPGTAATPPAMLPHCLCPAKHLFPPDAHDECVMTINSRMRYSRCHAHRTNGTEHSSAENSLDRRRRP